jgi:hypothetical protein
MEWKRLIGRGLLISILLSVSGNSAFAKDQQAALKDTSLLAGAWEGKIKVVPRDLGPIRKFNLQLKLSNPRLDEKYPLRYIYDVAVNVAPEGKPLVRSNFSDLTIQTSIYQITGTFDYLSFLDYFRIAGEYKTSNYLTVLEGCEKELTFSKVDVSSAKGPWKGEVECNGSAGAGSQVRKGEITLWRGQFDESVASANVTEPSERMRFQHQNTLPQQNDQNQRGSLDRSVVNKVDRIPGILRNIFR